MGGGIKGEVLDRLRRQYPGMTTGDIQTAVTAMKEYELVMAETINGVLQNVKTDYDLGIALAETITENLGD